MDKKLNERELSKYEQACGLLLEYIRLEPGKSPLFYGSKMGISNSYVYSLCAHMRRKGRILVKADQDKHNKLMLLPGKIDGDNEVTNEMVADYTKKSGYAIPKCDFPTIPGYIHTNNFRRKHSLSVGKLYELINSGILVRKLINGLAYVTNESASEWEHNLLHTVKPSNDTTDIPHTDRGLIWVPDLKRRTQLGYAIIFAAIKAGKLVQIVSRGRVYVTKASVDEWLSDHPIKHRRKKSNTKRVYKLASTYINECSPTTHEITKMEASKSSERSAIKKMIGWLFGM